MPFLSADLHALRAERTVPDDGSATIRQGAGLLPAGGVLRVGGEPHRRLFRRSLESGIS